MCVLLEDLEVPVRKVQQPAEAIPDIDRAGTIFGAVSTCSCRTCMSEASIGVPSKKGCHSFYTQEVKSHDRHYLFSFLFV